MSAETTAQRHAVASARIDARGPQFTAAVTALVLVAVLSLPTPAATVLIGVQALLFADGDACAIAEGDGEADADANGLADALAAGDALASGLGEGVCSGTTFFDGFHWETIFGANGSAGAPACAGSLPSICASRAK